LKIGLEVPKASGKLVKKLVTHLSLFRAFPARV